MGHRTDVAVTERACRLRGESLAESPAGWNVVETLQLLRSAEKLQELETD